KQEDQPVGHGSLSVLAFDPKAPRTRKLGPRPRMYIWNDNNSSTGGRLPVLRKGNKNEIRIHAGSLRNVRDREYPVEQPELEHRQVAVDIEAVPAEENLAHPLLSTSTVEPDRAHDSKLRSRSLESRPRRSSQHPQTFTWQARSRNDIGYFVIIRLGVALGVCSAGEITSFAACMRSASHVFKPVWFPYLTRKLAQTTTPNHPSACGARRPAFGERRHGGLSRRLVFSDRGGSTVSLHTLLLVGF